MAQLNTTYKLTHPLAQAVVTVRVTRQFRLRLWIAVQLTHLAVWIAGGEFEVEDID